MKKIVFAFALFLLQAGIVSAQDTVRSVLPPDSCFYNLWPNFESHEGLFGATAGSSSGDRMTFGFVTQDTITVYGIAAILGTLKQLVGVNSYGCRDTTLNNVFEYLCMYQQTGDTIFQKGEDLLVHAQNTPVSFYQDFEMWNPFNDVYIPILPVYERYFETPQTVHDTFFVGRTNYTNATIPSYFEVRGKDTVLIRFAVQTMCHATFLKLPDKPDGPLDFHEQMIWSHDYIGDPETREIVTDSAGDTCYEWRLGISMTAGCEFIFPIFAPLSSDTTSGETGHDTVSGGNDTLTGGEDTLTGIRPSALLEHYTRLLPNPASNHVRVVSSFGLKQIKAYALSGEQILSQHCSGYSVDLDISHWPAGSYTLVITTHDGTVTKKLLVQ